MYYLNEHDRTPSLYISQGWCKGVKFFLHFDHVNQARNSSGEERVIPLCGADALLE